MILKQQKAKIRPHEQIKPNAIGNIKEYLQHYRLEKMVALKIVSEK